MVPSLSSRLEKADEDTLKEILREAESRLDAQLTMALASDMRAITFLGFMLAAVAVIAVTAVVSYTTRLNPLWIFAAAALMGLAGLI